MARMKGSSKLVLRPAHSSLNEELPPVSRCERYVANMGASSFKRSSGVKNKAVISMCVDSELKLVCDNTFIRFQRANGELNISTEKCPCCSFFRLIMLFISSND